MKKTLWIVLGIAILSVGSHVYFKQRNTHIAFSYLDQFQYIPSINCYEKGRPLSYFGKKTANKAVLLLHGYGASPASFMHLAKRLERAGIPYYAPLISGFALGDFHLLDVIQETDWERDALFGFDLLSSFAEEVDVIGHSEGGCLAVLLTAQRNVNQLILVDPYLFPYRLPKLEDRLFKRLIETPVIGSAISFLCPVVEQPKYRCCLNRTDILNPAVAVDSFGFKSVPLHSLRTLWQTQKMADLSGHALHAWASSGEPKTVSILYGEEDQIIDIDKIADLFQTNQVPMQITKYPHSGHDLLVDYDWKQVIADILQLVRD